MTDKKMVIEEIKSRGYWVVNIHPDEYIEQRLEINDLRNIIKKAQVHGRGWPYPYINSAQNQTLNILKGIECTLDVAQHREYWRFIKSGNFYHIFGFEEDWSERDWKRLLIEHNYVNEKDKNYEKKILAIGLTLYVLTEIFEFTKRLALQKLFDKNIYMNIQLFGLYERELLVDSFERGPMQYPFICKEKNPWEFENTISLYEIMNESSEFAMNSFRDIMRLFQWDDPPLNVLKNDQLKLLENKLI